MLKYILTSRSFCCIGLDFMFLYFIFMLAIENSI